MQKLGLILFLSFFSQIGSALEIDEKLTLRIVGTSETRKTMLVNRGLEDGLAKNDHAKFYVSSGVVARGVCIKVSPTRSVWSLYRLVNADFIRDEQVMKLKIAAAVKITKDESRMLVEDDSSARVTKDPRELGIPLAQGADDLSFEQNANMTGDVQLLEGEMNSLLKENREIFGMFDFGAISEKASPDNNLDDYTQEINRMLLRAGGELFFTQEQDWYTRFSFVFTFSYERKSLQSFQGIAVEEITNEFGFGVNLYPFKRPSQVDTLIHYFNYTFSLGTTSSRFETGSENGVGAGSSDTVDGSLFANSFGYGARYYTRRGYGVRLEISYYLRGDTYAEDSANTEWIKTRIGPRFLTGISKRF